MKLALKSTAFYVRNLSTRLPFRYGVVTLTHYPLLHLVVEAEAGSMVPLEEWSMESLEAGQ